jgi:RNA binding exosome subunit
MSGSAPVLSVDIRVFVHATEDVDKVSKAVATILPKQYLDDVVFTRENLRGHHGNPITLLKAEIKKKLIAESFAENLASKLMLADKTAFQMAMDRYVDESGKLYLRIDKQFAYLGEVHFCREDPIHIQIKLNTSQGSIEEICRELGFLQ